MGKLKKRFYYGLPQYRDNKNSLLFLVDKLPLDSGPDIYILSDCYNKRRAVTTLFPLWQDFLTYEYIIEKFLQFHELMKGKDPRTLVPSLRFQLVHVCLELGYKNISEVSKPSFENIADIFGQTAKNTINMEIRYKKVSLSDENILKNTIELMQFITDPIHDAI